MSTAFQPDDELLSAYIDGQLSADELRAVEEWLERDPAAQATVDELRSVSAMVQALPLDTLPASWGAALAARLDDVAARRSSHDQSADGAAMPAIPFGRSSRGWWYSGAAIAAAVAIVCFSQLNQRMDRADVALKAPAAGAEFAREAPAESEETASEETAERDAIRAFNEVPEMRPAPTDRASESAPVDGLTSDDMLADSMASDETASEELGDRTPAVPESLAEAIPDLATERPSAVAAPSGVPNTYLIVWADVPPETLRERQINRVLDDNGIQVQQLTDDWLAAAEPVRQQIELRNNLAANSSASDARGAGGFGGGTFNRFSVPERAAESSANVDDGPRRERESRGGREADVEIEGETILVEATADQIAACLVDMEQDPSNYTAITVEPVQPEVVADQMAGMMRGRAITDESGAAVDEQFAELQQTPEQQSFTEGVLQQQAVEQSFAGRGAANQSGQIQTLPRARRLARPDEWYYYNTAPQDTTGSYKIRSPQTQVAKAIEQKSALEPSAGKREQLANINRLLSEQNRQTSTQQQLLTDEQPVQVLFVLRNTLLPEPATVPPAAEAAPVERP